MTEPERAEAPREDAFVAYVPILPRTGERASLTFHLHGGYPGPEGPWPNAVLFALWPSGWLVWCDSYRQSGATYRATRLEPAEVDELTRRLDMEQLRDRPTKSRHAPMHATTITFAGRLAGRTWYEHQEVPIVRTVDAAFTPREFACDDGCEESWNRILPVLAQTLRGRTGEAVEWTPIFRPVALD